MELTTISCGCIYEGINLVHSCGDPGVMPAYRVKEELKAAKGGVKNDSGKPPCELLSPVAMIATSEVLAFGAKKYAAHNWRKGLAWMRISGAIMRHLFAFMNGEDLDPETGLPHIDHAACEIMFLQELYRTRKDLDDRYKAADVPASTNNKEQ